MDDWCSTAGSAGFLAGILTFVPYIGAFVSARPSLPLAVSVNLELAIYVVLLYPAVHLIEGHILVPLWQRRMLHLPPALTLSAQIVLGVLAGFSTCRGQRRSSLPPSASSGWSTSKTCSVIARQPNPPLSTIRPHRVPRATAHWRTSRWNFLLGIFASK